MENLWLYLCSVVVYFLVWLLIVFYNFCYDRKVSPFVFAKWRKTLGIIALLCIPFNFGGYVFTVMGNAVGEKAVYSIFSVYQNSPNGNTVAVFGLPIIQKSGNEAVVLVGIANQKAENNAAVAVGIANQKAENEAFVLVGIANQKSGKDAAVFAGIANQKAENEAVVLVGISVMQVSKTRARTVLGIALYQRVRDKVRTFAVWSALTVD